MKKANILLLTLIFSAVIKLFLKRCASFWSPPNAITVLILLRTSSAILAATPYANDSCLANLDVT